MGWTPFPLPFWAHLTLPPRPWAQGPSPIFASKGWRSPPPSKTNYSLSAQVGVLKKKGGVWVGKAPPARPITARLPKAGYFKKRGGLQEVKYPPARPPMARPKRALCTEYLKKKRGGAAPRSKTNHSPSRSRRPGARGVEASSSQCHEGIYLGLCEAPRREVSSSWLVLLPVLQHQFS